MWGCFSNCQVPKYCSSLPQRTGWLRMSSSQPKVTCGLSDSTPLPHGCGHILYASSFCCYPICCSIPPLPFICDFTVARCDEPKSATLADHVGLSLHPGGYYVCHWEHRQDSNNPASWVQPVGCSLGEMSSNITLYYGDLRLVTSICRRQRRFCRCCSY